MQTHLLSLNTPPPILEINNNDQTTAVVGSVQNCVVIRNIGSSIAIRIPSLSQYGTVSAVHLTDDKYDDLQQVLDSFKLGQKLQCRIIGISLASNLAICTFKKSIIEAPFINYSNIEIGSLVK
ncbi:unnamed protein product, partial [Rotaria magnacalcarata]